MRKGYSLWRQAHFPLNVTQNLGCASTLLRLGNESGSGWSRVEVGWMDLPAPGCATDTPEQLWSCAELTLDMAPAVHCRFPGALSLFRGAAPLAGAQWTIPFDKAPHKCSQLAETKLCCFTATSCTSAVVLYNSRDAQTTVVSSPTELPAPTKFPLTWHILHKTAELPGTWNMAKYHFIVKP